MAFCVQCGKQLDSDSRFCSNCGLPVASVETINTANSYQPERKTEFEGNLRKCPNCGALVKAFDATCESCGHEFRNASSSTKVEEFELKYQSARSNKQRIVLVQSFSVPNTKEDVLEMFYLASANVGKSGENDKELDAAWQAKFEQAYMKAGIVLRDDPERDRVDSIYREKKAEIARWKRKMFLSKAAPVLAFVGIELFLLIFYIIAKLLGD